MISELLKKELQARVAHAVTSREAAVDVMKALQRHYGWLTDEAVGEAAELLGLTPLQVEELATFYEMIYRRPVGKRVIHVCDSISCWALGGESLMAHLAAALNIEPGGTTADGLFTLLPCCCLGNCGEAPTLMVGDTLHGRVTLERAGEILATERRQLAAAEG
ncbi:NADH-quinone oxidoreductase subunit NuoE [Geobacter sulfurreducens]|jgi:NADH-quinone oxidoreductase subunit E|uniref:NADH dehydrogenase I, E subunit n=1 Tax=Geobacter sulfurreducens (strain ATCC 51573 / DSM 12127 / PCA) TaxID=243231 RepID=Q746S5_GEOSL|nr:NADH-quinone oxidoreductase subunit NuoE [Geobacter sulfurreducens]AAR36833.1 NADH dehydrogenase I, E subunit [Geobacter sulfurreducens PCA]AJY69693.1 NADH dehydrogenase [Geobacter sulfurreducens]UAC04089.1 NADH-quinone oxidoreductase subunit NuoE [Geobacter sulfurreducens]UTG92726.1 NADH-quinone oxidoreductase subunit NuoE [Geobacter sulfurreducens]HBB70109.1 NADH-quinone oxidoreductase subunit NuoE [Geobacter sulfurreducens]